MGTTAAGRRTRVSKKDKREPNNEKAAGGYVNYPIEGLYSDNHQHSQLDTSDYRGRAISVLCHKKKENRSTEGMERNKGTRGGERESE